MEDNSSNSSQQSRRAPPSKQSIPPSRLPTASSVPHTPVTSTTSIPKPRESTEINHSNFSTVSCPPLQGVFSKPELEGLQRSASAAGMDEGRFPQMKKEKWRRSPSPALSISSSTSSRPPKANANFTHGHLGLETPCNRTTSANQMRSPPASAMAPCRSESIRYITQLEKQVAELKSQLEKSKSFATDTQLRLEVENRESKVLLENVLNDAEKFREEKELILTGKNFELLVANEHLDRTTKELGKIREEHSLMAQQLANLSRQHEAELVEVRETHIASMQELQASTMALHAELTANDNKLSRVTRELGFRELAAIIQEEKLEKERKVSEELRLQLSHARSDAHALQETISLLRADIATAQAHDCLQPAEDLKPVVTQLDSENHELRRNMASQDDIIKQLKMEITQATASHSAYEAKLEELNGTVTSARSEITQLQAKICQLQTVHDIEDGEKKDLLSKMAQETAVRNATERELAIARKDLDAKFQLLDEQNKASSRLTELLDDSNAQKFELSEKLLLESKKVSELEQVIAEMRLEINVAQSKIEVEAAAEATAKASEKRMIAVVNDLQAAVETVTKQREEALTKNAEISATNCQLHSTIADLTAIKDRLEEENNNNAEAMEICNESIEDLEKSLANQDALVNELSIKIGDLSTEKDETIAELEKKRIRVVELESLLTNSNENTQMLKHEIDHLQSLIGEGKLLEQSLQRKTTDLEGRLADLLNEMEILNERNLCSQHRIEQLEQKSDDQKAQDTESQVVLERAVRLEAELTKALEELGKAKQSLEQLSKLASDKENIKAERDGLSMQLADYHEQNEALKKERSMLIRDIENQRIAMTRQDESLKTLCFEFEEKSARFALCLSDMENTREELAATKVKLETTETELSNVKVKGDAMVKTNQGIIDELKNELKITIAKKDGIICDLELKLNDNSDLESANELIGTLRQENEGLKAGGDELMGALAEQKSSFVILQNKHVEELTRARNEYRELSDELARSTSETAVILKQTDELQMQLSSKQAAFNDLESTICDRNITIASLQEQATELQDQVTTLKDSLAQSRRKSEQVADLTQGQLEELSDKLLPLEEEQLANINLENERTEEKYLGILRENKRLVDRVELYKRQNKALQTRLVEAREHLGTVSSLVSMVQSNLLVFPRGRKRSFMEEELVERDFNSISQGDNHLAKKQMTECSL